MLFTLDSCAAGLSIPGSTTLGGLEEKTLKKFRSLAIIRGDTENQGRNLLVAGTGEQKALWVNGGIFTKALIDGLKGEGDLNGDQIIQFDELSLYVSNEVTAKAAETGMRQNPIKYHPDLFGDGKMLFLTPKQTEP